MPSRFIVGVDEAGYGCIAGPLVAAAVAFIEEQPRPSIPGRRGRVIPVRDSKRLSAALLEPMAEAVTQSCVGFEVRRVTPASIDELGAEKAKLEALALVARRLLERLRFRYATADGYRVVVDGHTYLGPCGFEYEALPRADATVWQVSAASVLAKQLQLQSMKEMHEEFPQYGWAENHGYPTEAHLVALRRHGVTPYHRRSYSPVQAIFASRRKEAGGGWEWD
jgi:ribonuclease HII